MTIHEFLNSRFFESIYVVMKVHVLEYMKVYGNTWQYILVHTNSRCYMAVHANMLGTSLFRNTFCIRIRAPLSKRLGLVVSEAALSNLHKTLRNNRLTCASYNGIGLDLDLLLRGFLSITQCKKLHFFYTVSFTSCFSDIWYLLNYMKTACIDQRKLIHLHHWCIW
jgi:hypothetical protein